MHSEYFNGNKKATVNKKAPIHLEEKSNTWEVCMYINDRIIQKTIAYSEQQAQIVAEDFVSAGSFISPTLLNEKLNG